MARQVGRRLKKETNLNSIIGKFLGRFSEKTESFEKIRSHLRENAQMKEVRVLMY